MTAPPSLTVARSPGDAVLVGGNVLTPSRDLYWTVTMTDMDAHPNSSTLLPFQPHSPEPGHPPPPRARGGWVGLFQRPVHASGPALATAPSSRRQSWPTPALLILVGLTTSTR